MNAARRKNDTDRLLDVLADLVADRVREKLGATSTRGRWNRIADAAISVRQMEQLRSSGVTFAKIGGRWCVDVASLDAYTARQAKQREEAIAPVAADDPLADVDASIRSRFLRAAAGGR